VCVLVVCVCFWAFRIVFLVKGCVFVVCVRFYIVQAMCLLFNLLFNCVCVLISCLYLLFVCKSVVCLFWLLF
jgi:hypothetical protein